MLHLRFVSGNNLHTRKNVLIFYRDLLPACAVCYKKSNFPTQPPALIGVAVRDPVNLMVNYGIGFDDVFVSSLSLATSIAVN